jgi:hypothetical protein
MHLKETNCEDVDWPELSQNRVHCSVLVNAVLTGLC